MSGKFFFKKKIIPANGKKNSGQKELIQLISQLHLFNKFHVFPFSFD